MGNRLILWANAIKRAKPLNGGISDRRRRLHTRIAPAARCMARRRGHGKSSWPSIARVKSDIRPTRLSSPIQSATVQVTVQVNGLEEQSEHKASRRPLH